MFTDAFLVHQRLGHEKVSTTPGTYDHLYPDRTSNVAGRLEALASPEEKKPWYWFDSAQGVTFSVALDAKKPRLQAKNLESRAVFYTLFRSIFDGFKKSEGKFLLLELGKFGFLLNKFV